MTETIFHYEGKGDITSINSRLNGHERIGVTQIGTDVFDNGKAVSGYLATFRISDIPVEVRMSEGDGNISFSAYFEARNADQTEQIKTRLEERLDIPLTQISGIKKVENLV